MLRLRTIAQSFIAVEDGIETWKIAGSRYKAAAVWKEIRPKKKKVCWHRLVWDPLVVPKHAVIAWMAILNRLPTMDRMRAWGIDKDSTCTLCKQEEESRNHLFFDCSYSKEVWRTVLSLSGLHKPVLDWQREFNWLT